MINELNVVTEETLIRDAIEKHSISIDEVNPNVIALVRYTRAVGYNEAFMEYHALKKKKSERK